MKCFTTVNWLKLWTYEFAKYWIFIIYLIWTVSTSAHSNDLKLMKSQKPIKPGSNPQKTKPNNPTGLGFFKNVFPMLCGEGISVGCASKAAASVRQDTLCCFNVSETGRPQCPSACPNHHRCWPPRSATPGGTSHGVDERVRERVPALRAQPVPRPGRQHLPSTALRPQTCHSPHPSLVPRHLLRNTDHHDYSQWCHRRVGNCPSPPPKFEAVGKFSSCQKTLVKMYTFNGWKSPILGEYRGKIEILSTHIAVSAICSATSWHQQSV